MSTLARWESVPGAPRGGSPTASRTALRRCADSVKRSQYLNTGEFMDALAEELKRTLASA